MWCPLCGTSFDGMEDGDKCPGCGAEYDYTGQWSKNSAIGDSFHETGSDAAEGDILLNEFDIQDTSEDLD